MIRDNNREISRLSTAKAGTFPIGARFETGNIPIMELEKLIQRLRTALEVRRISASAASEKAGLGRDYLRDLFRGKKQSVTSEALGRLAEVLDCDLIWLSTGKGELSSEQVAQLELAPDAQIDTSHESLDTKDQYVEYGGETEAGIFRPVDMISQEPPHRWIHLPRDPRYPKCRQYAFKVVGDSMNAAKIEDGMWAIAIDYDDYAEFHGEIRDGKRAIVERTRFQGSERELTVKEVRLYRDRMELIPRSTRQGYDPIVVPYNSDDSLDETVKILAIVTKSVWDLEEP